MYKLAQSAQQQKKEKKIRKKPCKRACNTGVKIILAQINCRCDYRLDFFPPLIRLLLQFRLAVIALTLFLSKSLYCRIQFFQIFNCVKKQFYPAWSVHTEAFAPHENARKVGFKKKFKQVVVWHQIIKWETVSLGYDTMSYRQEKG